VQIRLTSLALNFGFHSPDTGWEGQFAPPPWGDKIVWGAGILEHKRKNNLKALKRSPRGNRKKGEGKKKGVLSNHKQGPNKGKELAGSGDGQDGREKRVMKGKRG